MNQEQAEEALRALDEEMCETLLFTTCRRNWPNEPAKWCRSCRAHQLADALEAVPVVTG